MSRRSIKVKQEKRKLRLSQKAESSRAVPFAGVQNKKTTNKYGQ
jgi:hypothetical protein